MSMIGACRLCPWRENLDHTFDGRSVSDAFVEQRVILAAHAASEHGITSSTVDTQLTLFDLEPQELEATS